MTIPAGAAILIGFVVALPLGTLAAYRRGHAVDRLAQAECLFNG